MVNSGQLLVFHTLLVVDLYKEPLQPKHEPLAVQHRHRLRSSTILITPQPS